MNRASDISLIPSVDTNRLHLRAPILEDFDVYQKFFSDEDASRAYGGPLEPDQAWRVLATDLGHWALRGYGRWSLIDKSSRQMAGSCGLWWPEGYPRSELTWWVMPQFRRKGIAEEASKAAIAFGYNDLGWELVETHMNDENVAARGLVEKLGGKVIAREKFPDGLIRNVYSLPRP